MKIRKPKDNIATLYFFKIKDLEKQLGKSERARKKAEEENKILKDQLRETQEKNKQLEEENEQLLECRKSYAKMLFKGNTRSKSQPQRGRKKGYVGVSRTAPSEENITHEIDVMLAQCPHCESTFSGCKRKYSRIVEDIIIQPQTSISRYRIHQYECQVCGQNSAAKSQEIIGQSPFGRATFATVMFYRYRLHTPLKKIAECLREVHGLQISIGGVQNILYQASVQFGEKYEELKQKLINGDIAYADETGWRINGENWWVWLWSNDEVTIYTTEKTRGGGIPQKMLEKFKGLLHRDGYKGYNKVDTEQQICWVHLLRKAHEYCGRNKASVEMILLKDTLKIFYRRIQKWHRKKHPIKERVRYYKRMKKVVTEIQETKWKSEDTQTFQREWIKNQPNRLVTFLKYPNACGENNPAERALRPMVIFRKMSGGSKSQRGGKTTAINMSIIETWAKQNLSILQNIPVFGLSL